MKVIAILLLVILSSCAAIHAQQMPVFSQICQNQTTYNPGAIGNLEVFAANFSYRQQWLKIDGAPSTQTLCAHAPLKNPKVAMGILVEHETSGSQGYTGLFLNYAYRIKIGMNELSFGLKGGIFSGSQDNIRLRDDAPDPVWSDKNKTFYVPNFGIGVSYYGNKYWTGLSIPRLFVYRNKASDSYKIKNDFSKYQYFFSGGAHFSVNPDLRINPSVLFIYCPTLNPGLTSDVTVVLKNTYKAGLGFRTGEAGAVIFLLGCNVNRQFSLAYSYDFGISGLTNFSSSSHEINILYKFGYNVNAVSPRQF